MYRDARNYLMLDIRIPIKPIHKRGGHTIGSYITCRDIFYVSV